MKANNDYHQQLTPIVKEIAQVLENADDVDAEDLELELKHGFFKGPNYLRDKKQTVDKLSMSKVIILSMHDTYRKFKVNAGCDTLQFKNASSNLSTIAKKTGCKVEQCYFLFVNWLQERFLYDCSLGKWIRVDKNPLFKQSNVASKKKYYRVNFSARQQYIGVQELVKQLKVNQWLTNSGFMRFKYSLIYHVDSQFFIECNTVYETERESEYSIIEKIIQQDGNLDKTIRQTLEQKKKDGNIKTEIQLKITAKGINNLRKGPLEDQKILISRAFDQLRDITSEAAEHDIAKMMANLTLEVKEQKKEVQKEEKKQKSQKQKKQTSQKQKKQTEKDPLQPRRREYRKRDY